MCTLKLLKEVYKMAKAIVENGYSKTDIALTAIFTSGFILFLASLWMEFQVGAPHYVLTATAGSVVSIAATFIATMKRRVINITIVMNETE